MQNKTIKTSGRMGENFLSNQTNAASMIKPRIFLLRVGLSSLVYLFTSQELLIHSYIRSYRRCSVKKVFLKISHNP